MMFPSSARVVSFSVTLEAASSACARGVNISLGVNASLNSCIGLEGDTAISSTSTASPRLKFFVWGTRRIRAPSVVIPISLTWNFSAIMRSTNAVAKGFHSL